MPKSRLPNTDHLDNLLGAGMIRPSAWKTETFDREYAQIDLIGHLAESQIDE